MRTRGRRSASRSTRFGRNPFQIWVVIAATLTGVIALVPLDRPMQGVVEHYLPYWAAPPWYIGLVVGGMLTLLATLLPDYTVARRARLLGIEQVGMTVLGSLLLSYGAALEVLAPRLSSGLLTFALGVACVARWYQLKRERESLQHLVESLVEHGAERVSPPPE